MPKRTAIVLGGTGFIGGNVRARLAEDRPVHSFGSGDADLTNLEAVRRLLAEHGRDAQVVLCSSIGRTTEDSYAAFLKNVAMARNVAEASAECKAASLVYLSSTDVYGTPPAELPVTETTLPRPDTFYGASKLSAESLIELTIQRRIPAASLRLPGIYGPGERNRSIVNLFLDKARNGVPLTLSGGGTILRDYVFVHDLAEIIARFLDRPASGVFNIATGAPISLRELAEAAFEVVGETPRINLDAARDSRSHDLVFDTKKLARHLGNFRFTPLKEAMRERLK